jgi:hypothetical protein
VARSRIDHLLLASVTLCAPGIEQGATRCGVGGRQAGVDEAVGGPRARREPRRLDGGRGAGLGPEHRRRGHQAAVEERCVVSDHAQHEHQPAGRPAAAVVVGDDRRLVADAQAAHGCGERFGTRKGVTALGRRSRVVGEVGVEVDEPGTWQVTCLEGRPTRPSVEVPADIGQRDGLAQAREIARRDDRIDHATMFARGDRAE